MTWQASFGEIPGNPHGRPNANRAAVAQARVRRPFSTDYPELHKRVPTRTIVSAGCEDDEDCGGLIVLTAVRGRGVSDSENDLMAGWRSERPDADATRPQVTVAAATVTH
jgi:hypothetical protein